MPPQLGKKKKISRLDYDVLHIDLSEVWKVREHVRVIGRYAAFLTVLYISIEVLGLPRRYEIEDLAPENLDEQIVFRIEVKAGASSFRAEPEVDTPIRLSARGEELSESQFLLKPR